MMKKRRYSGPTIVIVGPTGSGKTGVAIEIAQELRKIAGGVTQVEIISADSRAIYKEMDIGTAKPSKIEQTEVLHHGLDLVCPGERFTVADWKQYAEQKITEIRARGNLPMVVGGTGLYVDALVFNYQFNDIVQKSCSDREKMSSGYKIFGIKWNMEMLRKRLVQRVNKIFVQELWEETAFLVAKYGWESQAMKSNIYQFVWKYLKGELSLEEAKEKSVTDDYQLAKRQMTWFKRNPEIEWLSLAEMKRRVLEYIQDEQRK